MLYSKKNLQFYKTTFLVGRWVKERETENLRSKKT